MAKCQTAVSSFESGSTTTISAARYTSRSTSCNEGNAPPLPTGPRPVKYSSSTMIVAAVSDEYADIVSDETAPPPPYRASVPTSRFRYAKIIWTI
jgi:hypothetical protein